MAGKKREFCDLLIDLIVSKFKYKNFDNQVVSERELASEAIFSVLL